MEKKKLLFEIGLEDLPAKNLNIFSEKLKKNIEENFFQNNIDFESIDNFYTNIRLIFLVNNINEEIILEKKLIKGPPLDKCFDQLGKPTKTGLGFAKKYGSSIEDLSEKELDGKKYLYYEKPETIINVKDKLPNILEDSINKVEEQKKMRWGSSKISFIRPIRWMLLLLEKENISSQILGIKTEDYTFGNKSLSGKKIQIRSIEEYFIKLKSANIEINHKNRQKIIQDEIENIIDKNGYDKKIDLKLISELTNMVEYPYIYLGKFPKKYLDLPDEVLTYVIQETQKYSLVFKSNKITNNFIGVSNVIANKNIIQGNERVINPRLDDAQFFISKDLSNNIFKNKEFLKRVIFHKKLGSMFDKVQRIIEISNYINAQSYQNKKLLCKEIAEVCKLDLISNMVVEIPKLQGYIGSYYANKIGLDPIVADGIKDHYAPRNPEDNLPKSSDAKIVSLADKLDTIVGIFLVKEKPSGTRDPLGIRRSVNGVLKILLEINYSIDLTKLINEVHRVIYCKLNNLKDNQNALNDCETYIKEKLFSLFKENYNYEDNVIRSVVDNTKNINPHQSQKKIKAINTILTNDDYQQLFSNAKRVSNILKKSNLALTGNIKENLLRESSEKILYNTIIKIEDDLKILLAKSDYENYLKELNSLNSCIKTFFEEVMINDKEEGIKLNRLSLLSLINNHYNNLANIAILRQ